MKLHCTVVLLQFYLQLWFQKGENNSRNDSSNPSTINGKNCYKVAISWRLDGLFFLHIPSISLSVDLTRLNSTKDNQDSKVYHHRTSINRLQDEKFQDVGRHRNWLTIKRKETFPRRSVQELVIMRNLNVHQTPYPGWQHVKHSIHDKVPTPKCKRTS